MTLEERLGIDERIELGSRTFDAEAIKAFARRYDPQPFHVDEALAEGSVFGALCASGWHTASVWMRLNVQQASRQREGAADRQAIRLEWGPSPGFQMMRWPKPVYAGETVRFFRTALSQRRLASRPGWRVLTMRADATDGRGDQVLDFEGAVLFRAI